MSRLKTDAIRNVNASVDGINLDTSGNVGLGTTSPNTKLHVEGTGTIAEFKSTNNNYLLQSNNWFVHRAQEVDICQDL